MIKIKTKNANLPLSQKEYDRLVENKNTMNLTNRLTTKQIKQSINNRTTKNKCISLFKSILPYFITTLVIVVAVWINWAKTSANELSIQDKIRLERLEICQQAYKLSNIEEKQIYWQIPAVRCATYMTLIYAYESNYWTSRKCTEHNNCWWIKGNWYDTPKGFLHFKTQRSGRMYFAKKYFRWHYKKNVSTFVYNWSMTDRETYIDFVNSKWFEIYRQLTYLLRYKI